MSTRFATTIGLPSAEKRPPGVSDLIAHRQPTAGALVRSKGSLYLLAQLRGDDQRLTAAARDALETVEREYYRDLSGGVGMALERAVATANRRLHDQRAWLGIPERSGIGIVALVIRGRDAHVARLGEGAALLVRAGRMYELRPPTSSADTSGTQPRRRVASSAGEARDVAPYVWEGSLSADDRLALVSRHLGRSVGADEMKQALSTLPAWRAVDHLRRVFRDAGAAGSDGILALHVTKEPATGIGDSDHVRTMEPLAGLAGRSEVPLADAIGSSWRLGAAAWSASARELRRAAEGVLSVVLAFIPRSRPSYPRSVEPTADRLEGRRRRFGVAGVVAVAALVAVGGSVAALPSAGPGDAIPRAAIARAAISEAAELMATVEVRVSGADLVGRDPSLASELLDEARLALDRAAGAGVPGAQLAALQQRLDRHHDALHHVTRIGEPSVVADLAALFERVEPEEMVAASDGSLWIRESGGGQVLRVDPADGSTSVVYSAGAVLELGEITDEPWLIATAATDVVVIDRNRAAWRIDLLERVPRPMTLAGAATLSPETTLLAGLQHRPPLEIFSLYVVDPRTGGIGRWSPPPAIPVEFPDVPEPFLAASPDLDPRRATDLLVDVNAWLLHAGTVTRVDFGSPRRQDEYSLDSPPDASLRPTLDYRLLDVATIGDRELLYVYDAAGDRIIAFRRADGAFVRQWLAPTSGPAAGALDDVRGLSVSSVADGPPVALLLSGGKVLRLVLE